MSENVLPFPRPPRNAADNRSRSNPLANQIEIDARNLARLREIEQEIKERKGRPGGQLSFSEEADRLNAGLAIGELKAKLLTSGTKVADVKLTFPNLYRYLIEPVQYLNDLEAAKKRAAGMVAFVRKYLEAAQSLAEAGAKNSDFKREFDTDKAKIHVLRNTSIWQRSRRSAKADGGSEMAEEAASKLALLVQQMSARIIRDSGLTKLFARMRRVPGQWDNSTGRFRESGMACLFQSAYQEGFEVQEEAPPLPGVPLVRLRHAGWTLPVRVTRDGAADLPDDLSARYSQQPLLEDQGEDVAAEVTLYREIRLALGPTVNAKTLGPLFESRPYSELRIMRPCTSEFIYRAGECGRGG
jgi:hypothetical protein